MTLFEFLMVFVSIIVGLGVTEILRGIARQIRYRETISGYWVHTCGVAALFLALVQTWWELWNVRSTAEWGFSDMVLMLASPAGFYLIAHLLFPEPVQNSNFKAHYYGAMRPVWWLLMGTVALSTLWRPLAFGTELMTMDNATSLLVVIGCSVLATSRNATIHGFLLPVFLLALVWDILWWNPINV